MVEPRSRIHLWYFQRGTWLLKHCSSSPESFPSTALVGGIIGDTKTTSTLSGKRSAGWITLCIYEFLLYVHPKVCSQSILCEFDAPTSIGILQPIPIVDLSRIWHGQVFCPNTS
jgi:hypothetical protein